MWGREDAQLKEQSLATRSYERVWLPSKSLGGAAAGYQGIFYNGYGPPSCCNRCGSGGANNSNCGYASAAVDFPTLALDIVDNRIGAVRGNEILLNFGPDFQWENAISFPEENFGSYFAYLDGLIDALNNDPQKRFNAF
jgi:hypothetical protein